jgi:hypothetical protein
MLTCGPGAGRFPGCHCTRRSRGLVSYPGGDHDRQAPVQPGALARRGRGVDRLLHVPALMSWRVIAAMTGATNRPHSRRWVSACLADHGLPVGCRAGDRYQAIRSAPAARPPADGW